MLERWKGAPRPLASALGGLQSLGAHARKPVTYTAEVWDGAVSLSSLLERAVPYESVPPPIEKLRSWLNRELERTRRVREREAKRRESSD
jgi:transposase